MSPKSIFGEGEPPREQVKGDRLINYRKVRRIRIRRPDGGISELPLSEMDSTPDEQGNYIDHETHHLYFDESGSAIPEPERILCYSHTGAVITDIEQRGRCTSIFHPADRIRWFYNGYDGHLTGEGVGICSQCGRWRSTMAIVGIILAIGVVAGIYSGLGWF